MSAPQNDDINQRFPPGWERQQMIDHDRWEKKRNRMLGITCVVLSVVVILLIVLIK